MNDQTFLFELNLSASLDACTIFELCSDEHGAIFFDSGTSEHESNRYDIILSAPIADFTHQDNLNEISLLNGQYHNQTNEDPFIAAARLHKQLKPNKVLESDLPFLGGSAGWFSYDLGRTIEKIANTATQDISLPQLKLGIYDWAIIKDNQVGKWYGIDYQPELNRIGLLIDKLNLPKPDSTPFELTSDWLSNMTQSEYETKFDQVKNYIEAGDCYQINLAQRFSAHYKGNEWLAYKALRNANKAPFSAFIRQQDYSILSISPERFLQLIDDQVQTKPIKGTIQRGQSLKQDNAFKEQLQKSQKDRAENLMIVDLLRNDISRVCRAGSVRVPKLFEVETFPSVHHLVSTVSGELKTDLSAFDLMRACFPGGSITGAPKVRAMEIIESLEPQRRTAYCGAITYIDWRGNMDSNIAIRSLVAKDNKIHCWAGGGLVMDSIARQEYQETLDKVNKILPILNATKKDKR